MFDVLIKNGVIIDGTGELMYQADIGINEEKISKIGQLQNEKGKPKLMLRVFWFVPALLM